MSYAFFYLRIRVMACLVLSLCSVSCAAELARLPDGSEFSGELKDGLLAHGELVWPNGDRYVGDFAEGVMTGEGELILATGERYAGTFKEGDLNGKGTYTGADGEVFEGTFVDGDFGGWGKYTDTEGNVYSGNFNDGLLSGFGTYRGVEGETYTGQFEDFEYHGKGIWKDAEGTYTGDFNYGYFHGQGEYVYKDDERKESGEWEWGEFIGATESRDQRFVHARQLEQTLYRQQEALAQEAASVHTGDAAKTELFLLTLAGDGRQQVFARELETVNQTMDQYFATEGRRFSLSNHPSHYDLHPLATLTGFEYALDTLTTRMNAEQDILFIYLTSHGSRKHEFTLAGKSLNFADMPADYIADTINNLPIKWKVIAISSCYSGGFIPKLKAPGHLIMTASRDDRNSFGCGDDDTMTYFGRAFFNEALVTADSFEQAFEQAKTRIDEWENEQDYTHSEPQIFIGDEIGAILKRWWPKPDTGIAE